MGRKFRPKAVAAAIEDTYGTDKVPTAGANAIEVVEAEIEPLNADEVEHNVDRGTLGNYLSQLVGRKIMVKFKVAVAGAGTAGNAPGYDPLFRMCQMAGVADPGTDYRFNFIGGNEESGTIYFWMDGALHKCLGARGTWSLELSPKQILYWSFDFKALYIGPTEVAIPSVTLTAFQKPVPVSNANTTFELHTVSVKLAAMSLAANVEVTHRDMPGDESVNANDRKPGGSVTIIAPDLSSKDYFATVTASTLGNHDLAHGTAAGNIVEIKGPQCQLSTIGYSNTEGDLSYPMNTRFIPTATGNDELEIIVR